MKELSAARWPWLILVALLGAGLVVSVVGDRGPGTTAERARALSETIECPTCDGQSVADSSSAVARNIRTEVARRIEAGESDEEIRDYIGGLYGEERLLTPSRSGVAGLVWFLPVALFVLAIGGLAAAFRRWRTPPDTTVSDEDRELVERARNR